MPFDCLTIDIYVALCLYRDIMTDTQSSIVNQSAGGATSVQGLFLIHHLMALQRLQEILTQPYDSEDKRWSAFNMQSIYLWSLITDDGQRMKVKSSIQKRELELKKEPWFQNEQNNQYVAKMAIVTELCRYLSQSMDLIHHDIISAVGSGTSDVDAADDALPVSGDDEIPVSADDDMEDSYGS